MSQISGSPPQGPSVLTLHWTGSKGGIGGEEGQCIQQTSATKVKRWGKGVRNSTSEWGSRQTGSTGTLAGIWSHTYWQWARKKLVELWVDCFEQVKVNLDGCYLRLKWEKEAKSSSDSVSLLARAMISHDLQPWTANTFVLLPSWVYLLAYSFLTVPLLSSRLSCAFTWICRSVEAIQSVQPWLEPSAPNLTSTSHPQSWTWSITNPGCQWASLFWTLGSGSFCEEENVYSSIFKERFCVGVLSLLPWSHALKKYYSNVTKGCR